MKESKWRELIIDGYNRIPGEIEHVLDGLSADDLEWQPRSGSNSIGWTVWHLARVEDSQISDLMGKEQLWIKNKWYGKFQRSADAEDTGYKHTPQQVRTFRSPSRKIYLDYLRAVTKRTQQYLNSLNPSDLNRKLDEPWYKPVPMAGIRIVSILIDCHQHLGEASYIRGLLKSKD